MKKRKKRRSFVVFLFRCEFGGKRGERAFVSCLCYLGAKEPILLISCWTKSAAQPLLRPLMWKRIFS